MTTPLRRTAGILVALTLLTGVAYPLAITGLAAIMAPWRATGSIIERGGVPVGSSLLGQAYGAPGHFWSRPSATAPQPYAGGASAASNLGPTNPALARAIAARADALRAASPDTRAPVPVDLVTASASGLDPDISVAAAEYQVARVARARGVSEASVRALVRAHTQGPTFGVLGEARVHVLPLNLALDAAR